ncbi:MAG: hypothetical protein J6A16_01230, partial [Oscillospiraceae bacterium]|nr:hypothetical protein [Oscillospiraceae bacterium]
ESVAVKYIERIQTLMLSRSEPAQGGQKKMGLFDKLKDKLGGKPKVAAAAATLNIFMSFLRRPHTAPQRAFPERYFIYNIVHPKCRLVNRKYFKHTKQGLMYQNRICSHYPKKSAYELWIIAFERKNLL